MMKLKTLAVVLVCIVCVFASPLMVYMRRHQRKLHGIGVLMACTSSELESLALGVQSLVEHYGKGPPSKAQEIVPFFNGLEPYFLKDLSLDQKQERVVDYFGNPIELVVKDEHRYVFISPGPNGRYEEGKGDDIVYEFDPWEDVEANEPNEPPYE